MSAQAFRDAQLVADGLGGFTAVAGNQDHTQPPALQPGHHLLDVLPQLIAEDQHCGRTAAGTQIDKRTAGRIEQPLLSLKRFREKFSRADFDLQPRPPQTAHPVSLGLHYRHTLRPDVTFAGFAQQFQGDGVRGPLLEAGGQGEGLFAGEVAEGDDSLKPPVAPGHVRVCPARGRFDGLNPFKA